MKMLVRLLFGVLVSSVTILTIVASPALAQDKKGAAKLTVLLDNDKVRVFEVRYQPGDENKAVPSANNRVVRALQGGTLTRTYADGKTEKVEWKTGEAKFLGGDKTPYVARNTGKSEVHLYVVVLK